MSDTPVAPPHYDTISGYMIEVPPAYSEGELSIVSEPKKLSKCPMYALIGVLVISVILIIVLASCYGVSQNKPTRYILAIDCGLKATKFSLFKYKEKAFQTNAWIEQLSYSSLNRGISSYADDPVTGANAVLTKANEIIKAEVPADDQKNTHVFLGAVAGVRILEYQDKAKADALVKALQDAFGGSALVGSVTNVPQDVRVVPGNEQGFDAWAAVNYLNGKFGTFDNEDPQAADSMFGAVNMGGASSQLTFVPGTSASSDEFTGSLFGQSYSMYSSSNLCYGIATLGDRYKAKIISDAGATTNPISSPCHQTGFSTSLTVSDLFYEPCTPQEANTVVGPAIPKPAGIGEAVQIEGAYNKAQCLQILETLFVGTPFANSQRPALRGNYMAIHKLWETVYAYVGGDTKSLKTTYTDYTNLVDTFCLKDYSTFPPDQSPPADKCLHGWIVEELLKNYGFASDTEWNMLTFFEGVGENVASWSTGYALDSSKGIPSDVPQIYISPVGFWIGIGVLIFAILLSTGGLILDYRSRH